MATKAANLVNPNAEIVAQSQCLQVNVAARGLQTVVKTNLPSWHVEDVSRWCWSDQDHQGWKRATP